MGTCCSLAKRRTPVWQSCRIHNQMLWKTAAVKDPKLPPTSEAPFLAVSSHLSILPGEMDFTFQPRTSRLTGIYFFSDAAVPLPFYAPLSSDPFPPRPSSCWKAQFAAGNANRNSPQRWVVCYTGALMCLLFPLPWKTTPKDVIKCARIQYGTGSGIRPKIWKIWVCTTKEKKKKMGRERGRGRK